MNSIKSLGLEKALELYFIVQPYIPKDKNLTIADACSQIFQAMSGREVVSCITILTGLDKTEIIKANALDYYVAIVNGLKDNNILFMQEFFSKIGFID